MSEVKRISVFIHGPNRKVDMVEAVHLDRVTAERDALQLDLNQRDEQIATLESQREAWLRNSQAAERLLTAADERADKAANLLEIWRTWLGPTRESCDETGKRIWDRIDALTGFKSAEGGSDA